MKEELIRELQGKNLTLMDEVKSTSHKLTIIEEWQWDLNDAKMSFNWQIDQLRAEVRDKDDFIQ